MMDRLFGEVGDLGVAAEANIDTISLGQTGLRAGVRIVAIGAISSGTGVLHFCGFDLLGLFVMAHHAKRLCVSLRQDDFSVFRRGVANFALLIGEGRMRKFGHQLRHAGLVWVVALNTIRSREGLISVRLLEGLIFGVMAINA